MKRVVILIDSKLRDLPVASLIAYHLTKLGITCYLQPLESYRSALAAIRPHMIIFNHMSASHLSAYSRRLQDMGVKTAVLLNEGIIYDKDNLAFNAGQFHGDAHIDDYFCWNEVHRDELIKHQANKNCRYSVVGVPRFDFYFKPWSSKYETVMEDRQKPVVLLCTNFQVAIYWELPREEAEQCFASWKERVPAWGNYWKAVEDSYKGRQKLFSYLDRLVESEKYHIILRPHPREKISIYNKWRENLPPRLREQVTLDQTTNISALILSCDLEISCETCTTAIESWICGKPTVELTFERNPLWFHEEHAAANVLCDNPDDLVETVDNALNGTDPGIMKQRQEHLRRWCYKNDGAASLRVAKNIAQSLDGLAEPNWSKLNWSDHRRGLKQRLMNALNKPAHYNPFMILRYYLNPTKYLRKYTDIKKSIHPSDVKKAHRDLIELSQNKMPPES